MTKAAHTDVGEHSNAFGDELPPGSLLCGGQYTIERYLNSGGFGITYLARDSLGRRVVIKECFPGAMCYRSNQTVRLRSRNSDDEFDRILGLFEREARALAELEHPYIVGVHQIFQDNGTSYMALDFVEGKDLLQVLEDEPERLGPAEIKQLLIQLLDAVSYIHKRDILHRDISPDNILLDKDNLPVLIDFGAARESATRVSRVLSKVVTVKDGYSPQEFYLAGSKHEYASDLYALAATFYHLVSGKAPPNSQMRMAAVAKNADDPLEPLDRSYKGYEDYFIGAINQCLSVFPKDRIASAEEWRDRIDVERRQQLLLEQAKQDREIELRISQMISEAHGEMHGDESPATPAEPEPPQARAAVAASDRLPAIQSAVEPGTADDGASDFADLDIEPEDASDGAAIHDAVEPRRGKRGLIRRFILGSKYLRLRRDPGAHEQESEAFK